MDYFLVKKNRFKIDIPDKNSQIIFHKLAEVYCKLKFQDPKGDFRENSKLAK
jgi:hypothetical protein